MMNFKEFRRLYTGDPATLHITMELLLQNGREILLGTTESEIVSSLQGVLQNFSRLKNCVRWWGSQKVWRHWKPVFCWTI